MQDMLQEHADINVRLMGYKCMMCPQSASFIFQTFVLQEHSTSTTNIMKATLKVRSQSTKVTEMHLNKACDQMQHILAKISEVKTRHQRALKHNQPNRVRQLKVQLQVLQGMYNIFHQYADHKARQMAALYLNNDQSQMAC